MRNDAVRYPAALLMLAVAGASPSVLAQNAIGNGRALERPLQTIHPGAPAPPRNSFSQELLFREAIVSGQAPSGLSFRGSGALPSRFEFRGELAEDAIFSYRRDSLYSGLAGRGIRGTEALQYQFALTTGGEIPSTLAGRLSYARAGEAERGDDPYQPAGRDLNLNDQSLRRPTDPDFIVPAMDDGSSMVQPVRSVSAYAANRSLQPTLVGVMQNRVTQQSAGQTASPLTGVQIVPIDALRDPGQSIAPNPDGTLPGISMGGATTPTVTAYDELLTRLRELTPEEPAGATPPGATPGVITPGAAPAATTPGAVTAPRQVPAWASDIVSVRELLRGLPPSTARALGIEPETNLSTEVEQPELSRELDADAPLKLEPAKAADAATFRADVLQRIREAGGLTESLIATKQPHIDRYAIYMQGAEDLLARERYFDAEERFISALTARPNDVNASVGRAHAQLGAGLFLSAGLNLRQLLVNHPEVAGMRYGVRLLPSPARLDEIAKQLRAGLGSPNSGADSGLLLAYIAFQRSKPEDIRQGLDVLASLGDAADQRLATMLRGVWLAQAPTDGAEPPMTPDRGAEPPASPEASDEGGG
ncbi:MAG TPA: hypothetical protein VFF69_04885 [Phycisphaerales bacterium]|nr:hypothetical protein [Phycisphaerales bacterium]